MVESKYLDEISFIALHLDYLNECEEVCLYTQLSMLESIDF